jgi:hypothetical protein
METVEQLLAAAFAVGALLVFAAMIWAGQHQS